MNKIWGLFQKQFSKGSECMVGNYLCVCQAFLRPSRKMMLSSCRTSRSNCTSKPRAPTQTTTAVFCSRLLQ